MADRSNARTWYNAVEEIVFSDNDFCDEEAAATLSKVQAMQAAYIVCLYQNWEGDERSKRRIRRQRFSALVSAARDAGIHNAKHSEGGWHQWALEEQLIRVLLWVFLLDTAFVIFNNVPPRMVIKEMTLDLACCEAAFQADSADLCFSLIQRHPLTFCRVVESLCTDELQETMLQNLADAGPLNMFAIASSIHLMLFQYQNSFLAQNQLVPVRNAVQNWDIVWEGYQLYHAASFKHDPVHSSALTADNMWKRIGFMKYASEYWLLASLLLDRICATDHQPVQDLQQPLLQQYDQTSMQQVNDLIADFQRTHIS